MMTKLCLVYLFIGIISVSSNPVSQKQPYNAYSPMPSNPTIPVAIQQPSSSSPYAQGSTVQVPNGHSGPLGETLNQIVMNRILANPSLQKILNPNTKLYNQNGDEVQRQAPNSGTPNVINNYFILPPEFFSLNETANINKDAAIIDQSPKRPRRRKLKRKLHKLREESAEDDVVLTKQKGKKRKPNQSKNTVKKKRIDDEIESAELVDERDEPQEITIRDQAKGTKPKLRPRKNKKEEIVPVLDGSIEDDNDELEHFSSVVPTKEKKENLPRKLKPKSNSNRIDNDSTKVTSEEPKPAIGKQETVFRDKTNEVEGVIAAPKKAKKKSSPESSAVTSEDKILKNIELPIDISNSVPPENRPTRDSNRDVVKKVPEHKNRNTVKKEPLPKSNMTPFPDDVLKNFYPYMPMDSFNNPHTNYPISFDQYYKYLDPVRNSNAKRKRNKQKKQNKKNNDANSNTHVIEIKLKPKKKENITETPIVTENPDSTKTLVTTEEPKDVHAVTLSVEGEHSTESIEEVTVIPMEVPRKVSPIVKVDENSSSKESYETFSKLEDLHDFIMPELGTEDEVYPICNNGIIDDYYPVFDDDIHYKSDVEMVNNKLDDRYLYKTENGDTTVKERRKLDRYEDGRSSKREKELKPSDSNAKYPGRDVNKSNFNEHLDHISTFSDRDHSEHDKVSRNDEIRRVRIPSKNTRVVSDSVDTVFAGSKVAKYGKPIDKTIDYSSVHSADENSFSGEVHTSYVIAESVGRPEDYW